jgi:2-oxoglutarate dehydrogenase E1 component
MHRLAASLARTKLARVSRLVPKSRCIATLQPGNDGFAAGANTAVLESIYDSWKQNPNAVSQDWQDYFTALDQQPIGQTSIVPSQSQAVTAGMLLDQVHLMELIRSYRVFGHLSANLDPLGLWNRPPYAELDYKHWGFKDADLDRAFYVGAPLADRGGKFFSLWLD